MRECETSARISRLMLTSGCVKEIHAESSQVFEARPACVYAILVDYHVHHPAILPKPYFAELTLEQGGRGAGTIIRVRMKVFGVEQVYRMTVTEPEPGRVLREEDSESGVTTTFTVEGLDDGEKARLTIATTARASRGIRGFFERRLNPPIMRRIFKKQLSKIAAYARAHPELGQ